MKVLTVFGTRPEAIKLAPVLHRFQERSAGIDSLICVTGQHREMLPYDEFAHLMNRAYLVVTDSGGIQEEAAAIGKPVIVVREKTEREESVEGGLSRLVGRDRAAVLGTVEVLLHDEHAYRAMARAECPYGDGRAALRITALLEEAYGSRGSRTATNLPGRES